MNKKESQESVFKFEKCLIDYVVGKGGATIGGGGVMTPHLFQILVVFTV